MGGKPAGYALIALITMVLSAVGCSSVHQVPVIPNVDASGTDTDTHAGQVLLGLYEIDIDPVSGGATAIPIRVAQFQVNVVRFLQPPAGDPTSLSIRINTDGTSLSEGLIDLDVSITHPFPGTNIRGFDVRGIVLGERGTRVSDFDHEATYPAEDEMRLLNADGYTRWWNAAEFLTPGLFGYTPTILGFGDPTATINGYKYFCDGLDRDDPLELDIETRGTFSTRNVLGDPNKLTRRYVIQFPMEGTNPVIRFRYAICASFLPPDPPHAPPAPVDAYPIEANCPEAYQVSMSVDPSSTAYYLPSMAGGDLVLNVEVFDWQALENPDGVVAEIDHIALESPTMWDGVVDAASAGVPSPTGNPTSSVWQVDIRDVTPTGLEQEVFVTVTSADPTSYAPPISGPIYPGEAVLSAYHLFNIRISDNSPPEIGEIFGPDKYVHDRALTFTLTSAFDMQDGPNVTIKWDMDGDRDFEDDEDGYDNNFRGTYTFTGIGETYEVQCRVYDTQGGYSDSNILLVEPISLPYIDPMDYSTQYNWQVVNGIFGSHMSDLEWNVQDDHWSTSSAETGYYDDYMDTTLICPKLPGSERGKVTICFSHRFNTEPGFDLVSVWYRINRGPWEPTSFVHSGLSDDYPEYTHWSFTLTNLYEDDVFDVGFAFSADSVSSTFAGWDITDFMALDNEPPDVGEIEGPSTVESQGPWTYSVAATDIDGIDTCMWSVEPYGVEPVYDDPGDGEGHIEITFPSDGRFDIWVQVTDLGDPPLSAESGPYTVTVFTLSDDPFFRDHFDEDTGAWTYTGGIDDGSYQDFWHIEAAESFLSNVGPDDCYAETDRQPIEKTASVEIAFPTSTDDAGLKLIHRLEVESGGGTGPHDGQWVTLDGELVEPSHGFLYYDNEGIWDHGYFVGNTDGWVSSTFLLGAEYNDGATHILTVHSLSDDTHDNCTDGWQIDLVELWLEE